MSRYQINKEELTYLRDMIEFLKDSGNSCSDEGSKILKDIFDLINSRPILDTMIHPSIFIEHADYIAGKKNEEETHNTSEKEDNGK
jgi:hypothetical protein